MSAATLTDKTPNDLGLTDLGPFFERYDRRNTRVMAMGLVASLILSTAIATRLLTATPPGLKGIGVIWGSGVVFTPLFLAAWWIFGGLMALRRRKAAPLDGSHPAGPDDARNGVRIANAGFVFNIALIVAMLAGQVLMALLVFGFGQQVRGDWIARGITLTVGFATIYLGNLWPRMPVSRAPEQKAAAKMKANRYAGWFMVIVGVLVTLWGVIMPITPPSKYAPPPFEASKHKEIVLPAAALDRFVGRYQFTTDFVVSVTRAGATLRVLRERSPGAQAAPIYPEGARAFFWKAVEAQIRFTIDAGGTVTGAAFRQGGAPWLPGKRITPEAPRPVI
jgi:hypothetical protein